MKMSLLKACCSVLQCVEVCCSRQEVTLNDHNPQSEHIFTTRPYYTIALNYLTFKFNVPISTTCSFISIESHTSQWIT